MAIKQFVVPKLKISESDKVFFGVFFAQKSLKGFLFENSTQIDNWANFFITFFGREHK